MVLDVMTKLNIQALMCLILGNGRQLPMATYHLYLAQLFVDDVRNISSGLLRRGGEVKVDSVLIEALSCPARYLRILTCEPGNPEKVIMAIRRY